MFAVDSPPASAPPLWSRSLLLICVVLLFGAMVPNVFVIASRYLGDQGFDKGQIGIVMGAYQIAVLAVTPFVVPLATRLRYRWLLVLGGGVAAVGAVGFAFATTLVPLVLARVAQGVGFAVVMVGAAALISETAPRARLAEALGVSGVVTLMAQAMGPVVAERCNAQWSVRGAFLAAAVLAVFSAACAVALPSTTTVRDHGRVRLHRALPGLTALAFGGLGFGCVWLFLADFAAERGVMTIERFFWPYIIAALTSRLVLGQLADRTGTAPVAAGGLLAHAACFAALTQVTASWHLAPIAAVYGFAHGLYYPALLAFVVAHAQGPRGKSVALGTFAFGVGIIVAAYGAAQLARTWNYNVLYFTAAAATLLAAAVMYRARSTHAT